MQRNPGPLRFLGRRRERACRDSFRTSETNSFQGQKKAGFLAKDSIRCYLRHHMGTPGGRPGLVQRVGRRGEGPWRRGWDRFRWRAALRQPSAFPRCSGGEGHKGRGKESPRELLPLSRADTKTFGHQPAYLSPRLLSVLVAQVKAPEFRSSESTQMPGRHGGPPVQDTTSSGQAG